MAPRRPVPFRGGGFAPRRKRFAALARVEERHADHYREQLARVNGAAR